MKVTHHALYHEAFFIVTIVVNHMHNLYVVVSQFCVNMFVLIHLQISELFNAIGPNNSTILEFIMPDMKMKALTQITLSQLKYNFKKIMKIFSF